MTAQRWLYSAITVAFGYAVYLFVAFFDREILLPSQHNSIILGVLAVVCLAAAFNHLIERRCRALREYLDRRFAYLEMRVDRIIDGPTEQLKVVGSAPVEEPHLDGYSRGYVDGLARKPMGPGSGKVLPFEK